MKTYYMADFSAFMCYFQIRVNDVEVFSLNVDGQTSTNIPLNQGILESGLQKIEVRVFPLKGKKVLHPEASVRCKVVAFDVSNGDFKFVNQFENFETLPVKKGVPYTFQKSTFEAKVPYKINAWQNGQKLKDFKDLKEKLIVEYNKIIHSIKSGNYQDFIKAYQKREQNIATAMYLGEKESTKRINEILYDIKNGFEIQPLPQNLVLEISGNDKLACLKRFDGMSALFLENKKTEEELILLVNFYLPQGKTEFEII